MNLPVKDLRKSVESSEGFGFRINPKFTDVSAACIVISDDISVMALTRAEFKEFTKKAIAESAQSAEVLEAITAESRARVDAFVQKTFSLGGKIHREPGDHGWMYGQSAEDLKVPSLSSSASMRSRCADGRRSPLIDAGRISLFFPHLRYYGNALVYCPCRKPIVVNPLTTFQHHIHGSF